MQLKHNDERSAYITVSRYGKPFSLDGKLDQ